MTTKCPTCGQTMLGDWVNIVHGETGSHYGKRDPDAARQTAAKVQIPPRRVTADNPVAPPHI